MGGMQTNKAKEKSDFFQKERVETAPHDLDSFFSMGTQPSSGSRPKATTSDPVIDSLFQSRGGSGVKPTSSGTSSKIKKSSSATNVVNDFSFLFGEASPSSGEFQEIEGESEERRKSRLNHHMRTQKRMAKALAEKNQRDYQTQQEQQERHRIAETLSDDIKRWAAGKEGNLRALLSSLQYVLWPECGWQPVSLTDLITSVSVKKVYYKATLCVHPDKVQQRGANVQQKFIAEKVFDLLKEAWNKFNSEELKYSG
ncbi:auxilin-related protein 2-like [Diospyros lotus]|uniref:auxilin-related protein 2-like n=1 Tax=Diospyros lotus TaxID=55363 RepID=UPI00224D94CE|nr:auxilin-related protein 2-like [Diospyros lotus]